MANLYKKAAERKKVVPGGAGKPQGEQNEETAGVTPEEPETPQAAPEAPVSEPITETVTEVVTEEVTEKPAEEKVEEQDPAPIRYLLEDLIPKKKKPKRGTYGFYLDSDVHDELVKLAKQTKTNKSDVLNTLLRRVLFDE